MGIGRHDNVSERNPDTACINRVAQEILGVSKVSLSNAVMTKQYSCRSSRDLDAFLRLNLSPDVVPPCKSNRPSFMNAPEFTVNASAMLDLLDSLSQEIDAGRIIRARRDLATHPQ